MLFKIGIESPKNKNEAFGVVVPIFEVLGFGCVTAADTEDELIPNIKTVILDMVEEVLNSGFELEQLKDKLLSNYQDRPEYSDFDSWLAVDVDLSEVKGKQQRVNVSMNDFLLARIESAVKNGSYRDRSNFLETAARNELNKLK